MNARPRQRAALQRVASTSTVESGAASLAAVSAVLFVLALIVGSILGARLRSSQASNVSPMDLGAPVERSTTSTSEAPRSTLDLPTTIDTTLPSETTVPPETDPPVTEPPAPDISLALGTGGAMLRSASESRLVDSSLGCDGFTQSATPGSARSCEQITVGDSPLTWLDNATTDQFELLIRDAAVDTGDQWRVVLVAAADAGNPPAKADVTGDGRPDLVFSRRSGNGDLQLDVVDVTTDTAQVVLHLALPNGRARESGGKLVVWFGFGTEGKLAQTTLDGSGGSFKSEPLEVVNESAVGNSQF